MQEKITKSALISANLRIFAAKSGKQQKEIAAFAGVSEVSLCRWLTGKRCPNPETLKKLAAFFNVDPSAFMNPAALESEAEAPPPEPSLEDWKARALAAEQKLAELQAAAASSVPLSGMSAEEYLTKLRSSLQFVFNFITQEASK